MNAMKIVLVSDHAEDIEFSKALAKSLGCGLEVTGHDLDTLRFIACHRSTESFYILSIPDPEHIQRYLSVLTEADRNRTHIIVSRQDIEKADPILKPSSFGHIIVRSQGDVTESAAHYARVIQASRFELPLGLSSFSILEKNIHTVDIPNWFSKETAINSIQLVIKEMTRNERLTAIIINALDELLLNALFDAPFFEANGSSEDISREISLVNLKNNVDQYVKVRVGIDAQYIGIMVVDQVGSINKARTLNRLFGRGQKGERTAEMWGGLGLAMILRTGGSLCIVCEPGVRTEITVFFKITKSFAEFATQFQFVATYFPI
jgi:hypothetical protein